MCLYACVLFRSRPLLLFAAGFFLSFLFSLAVTRTAFRNAPGDVFSTKESHSSPELSDALKTYENQSERGVYFRMLCLVGFSEKNIKKPEYLPRLVKISIIDFILVWQLDMSEIVLKQQLPILLAYRITYPLQILQYSSNLQWGLDVLYYPLNKGLLIILLTCIISLLISIKIYSKKEV